MNDMGSRLKKLRVDNNLTQLQLSELFGLANSAISSYESGTRYPSYDILVKYTRIFHVSSDYILGIEKGKMIDVSDLSETQVYAINQVISVFRNIKK